MVEPRIGKITWASNPLRVLLPYLWIEEGATIGEVRRISLFSVQGF
jgi:hypothetical protein